MRELLFRAWHPDECKYCYFDTFSEIAEWQFGDPYKSDNDPDACVTWEQFTGEYDINGKKVYEGDVLKDAATGQIRVVEYFAPSFILVDDRRYFYWHCHFDEQEIVGNIHEYGR